MYICKYLYTILYVIYTNSLTIIIKKCQIYILLYQFHKNIVSTSF